MQNDILRAIDICHCVILLLLDLSTAFGSNNHEIFLRRLNSKFLIYGTALDWFRSYLTDRKQSTLIKGKKKKKKKEKKSQSPVLKCGVPQFSVLLPILYLLYTAPLANTVGHNKMQFHFYAADAQLYISFSTNNDLQLTNTIAKIEEFSTDLDKWTSQNKLNFKKDKTELLCLYSKYNPRQCLPLLRFGTDTI